MLDKVYKIIATLNKNHVQYIIIGGYAIVLHGFLRATEDLDLLLEMTSENVKLFQSSLKEIYHDDEIEEINFNELKKYAVIRYGTPDNFYLDVISNIGELFSFNNIKKTTKNIDGIEFVFASPESLYEMKKNSFREKDKLDLLFLKEKIQNDTKI
jgi:predicted nucleotidyltransferase